MQSLKDFFSKKAAGFYVSALAAILSVVAAFVYIVGYIDSVYLSWWVFILSLLAALVFVVLSLFSRTAPWSPAAMGIAGLAAFLVFIRTVYIYLSEVFYGGINMESIMTIQPVFVACLLLLLGVLILSIAGIYMKQEKEEEK